MLVDVFVRRYDGSILRDNFEKRDIRLLVQAFRILADDIYPFYTNGTENSANALVWTKIHGRLSRELGVQELSRQWYSVVTKWNGNDNVQWHKHTILKVCENWFMQAISGSTDEHVKERLSLIELGFRERESEINSMNWQPITTTTRNTAVPNTSAIPIPKSTDAIDRVRTWRSEKTAAFQASVEELNTRFKQAGYGLNYHNGFIQMFSDALVQQEIETPFWSLVASSEWSNVDTDMKEALDLRDSGGRDPAFYAARSLESAIKIISERKGWTRGSENGAHNYIDNLGSKANGFITNWESENLKLFFTHVRNPFGHGPGSATMPSLSRQQTEWAIEFSMSWIKNLIRRL